MCIPQQTLPSDALHSQTRVTPLNSRLGWSPFLCVDNVTDGGNRAEPV